MCAIKHIKLRGLFVVHLVRQMKATNAPPLVAKKREDLRMLGSRLSNTHLISLRRLKLDSCKNEYSC